MKDSIEKILNFVCETCDMTKDELLSHNRTMPLPLIRGFFWYLVRRSTGYSNLHIAKITTHNGCSFTSAGVGSAIIRTMDAISHDKLWASRWKKAIVELDLAKAIEKDEEVVVSMVVPRGFKDKVKVDIKERK